MGWHHQTTGRGVHTPYRWIVADEAARLAIATNADGSTLTAIDGLYCKCLQTDTNTEYIISSLGPIVWTMISAGVGASAGEKSLISVTAPQTAYPFGVSSGIFTNVFMRRLVPNIGLSFEGYDRALWRIREFSSKPDTLISEYSGLQFKDYEALVTFLNANVANNGTSSLYNLQIEAYMEEDASIDPFRRVHCLNRFYSSLRGRDNYRSNQLKAVDTTVCAWPYLGTLVDKIYNDFLSTTAPPLENAAKTLWFSQSFNKIYCHHKQPLSFPASAGDRRYYNTPNSTTYPGVGSGGWNFDSAEFYELESNGQAVNNFGGGSRDKVITQGGSCIRVSMYRNSDNPDRVCFLVKPIGMDSYHLGFHPDLPEDGHVYVEYRTPDSYPRIIHAADLTNDEDNRRYGKNTYVSVYNHDFIQSISNNCLKTHVGHKSTGIDFRFFVMTDDGQSYPPSRWFKIQGGLPQVNVSILPI